MVSCERAVPVRCDFTTIFDSHVFNASSTHGLLIGYSAWGGFVLPWSRIQVEPYDMSSIIWGWYQINILDFVALFIVRNLLTSRRLWSQPEEVGFCVYMYRHLSFNGCSMDVLVLCSLGPSRSHLGFLCDEADWRLSCSREGRGAQRGLLAGRLRALLGKGEGESGFLQAD